MMVYVDNMERPYGRMKMSHMLADSTEELLAMADRIGVARKWVQHPGSNREHFDVSMSAKQRAIAAGALQVTTREIGCLTIIRGGEANCTPPMWEHANKTWAAALARNGVTTDG